MGKGEDILYIICTHEWDACMYLNSPEGKDEKENLLIHLHIGLI